MNGPIVSVKWLGDFETDYKSFMRALGFSETAINRIKANFDSHNLELNLPYENICVGVFLDEFEKFSKILEVYNDLQ